METFPHENIRNLTKREYFAAKAMQGLLANEGVTESCDEIEIAFIALVRADALIAELNKETT